MYLYKQVELSNKKEFCNSIQKIYGVGWHKSILISVKIGCSYPISFSKLNFYHFCILSCVLNSFTWLEVRIRRVSFINISRYVDIKCYRGIRHQDNLPVRGQRSRTNAGTKKRLKSNFLKV